MSAAMASACNVSAMAAAANVGKISVRIVWQCSIAVAEQQQQGLPATTSGYNVSAVAGAVQVWRTAELNCVLQQLRLTVGLLLHGRKGPSPTSVSRT
jgi:hypothetical protein